MRDIRPSSNNKPFLPPESESAIPPVPLPKLPIPDTEPTPTPPVNPPRIDNADIKLVKRITGAKVPVTNIVIPDDAYMRPEKKLAEQQPTISKKTLDTPLPKPPQPTANIKAILPITPKAAPKVTPKQPVRIGYRERKIFLGILGLVVLIAVLAMLIFLPKADITLVLQTAPLLVDEKIIVRAQDASGDNVIPGTAFFREVPVTGSATVASTEVIGDKAAGTVQLVNRTTTEQKIKEQSRLVTKDGTLFYTQKSVTIPAATNGLAKTPVDVMAADAGVKGNIKPQHLDFVALNSSSQTLVYAESTQDLKGGSGETVSVVKQSDIDAAKTVAGKTAKDTVEQDIRHELPKGEVVLEESWTMDVSSFDTQAKLDERRKDIPYTARVTVRVMGYENSALEKHLRATLEQHLDPNFMLFPGAISYTKTIDKIDWEKAEATLGIRVTHTTIPRLELDSLRTKLAGRDKSEAQSYLEGLPGVKSASINLWPFWVMSTPHIEKRINIDLQTDRQP